MAAAETRVGVLGGGQLGRMLAEAAHNNPNLTVIPLDPLGPASPAGQVASKSLTGSFKDAAAVTVCALPSESLGLAAAGRQGDQRPCTGTPRWVGPGGWLLAPPRARVPLTSGAIENLPVHWPPLPLPAWVRAGRPCRGRAKHCRASLPPCRPEFSRNGHVRVRTRLTPDWGHPPSAQALAEACDVITAEIEHVNCDVLDQLVAKGKVVRPSPQCIRMIQVSRRRNSPESTQDPRIERLCPDHVPVAATGQVSAEAALRCQRSSCGAVCRDYRRRGRGEVWRSSRLPVHAQGPARGLRWQSACGCVTNPRPPRRPRRRRCSCAACVRFPPLSRVPMGGWRCGATVIPLLPCIAEARPAARPTG